MRGTALSVGACNMNGFIFGVRMLKVLVKRKGGIKVGLIGHFANSLVHGELRVKIVERLLVVHRKIGVTKLCAMLAIFIESATISLLSLC